MSMVRLLVYSNQFDIEGLVATTSTWMRNRVRPDVIRSVIDAYEQVQPNLLTHEPGFPTPSRSAPSSTSGQPGYGMAAAGAGMSSGSAAIFAPRTRRTRGRSGCPRGAARTRSRRRCCTCARHARRPSVDAFVSKLRVYTISDQDDAGPWIRREFPTLFYIVVAVDAGRRAVLLRDVDRHQRRSVLSQRAGRRLHDVHRRVGEREHPRKGPLGKLYPNPCCIHEGDTPSFLGLIDNGLASAMSPTFGGWGGRYVWRQPSGEPRADLDAGRRLVSGQRQLARHRGRRRRQAVHVRPGDDLAMADGVPARLRGAHGLVGPTSRTRTTTPSSS